MNAESVGGRGGATEEARPSGRGFSRELARAEGRNRPQNANGGAEPKGSRSRAAGVQQLLASASAAPREVLLRRRGEADAKDDRLDERREVDRSARLETERGPASPQAEAHAELPSGASLAVAVERLEVALERRHRAQGPCLEMQFGGRLQIRLTRGRGGLELAISGDPAAARLARAELPNLLARLRQRGLAVSRAEVRASGAPSRGQPS